MILFTILLSPFVVGTSTLPFFVNIAEAQTTEETQASAGVNQREPKRLALVVGIDDYPENPLRLPVRDAELITQQLELVGFEVMLIKNPTVGALEEARDLFIEKIQQSGEDVTALFFFAGHAVQFDGHNYLIPANSNIMPAPGQSAREPGKAVFRDRAVDAQRGILDYLNESGASQIIFVLDACRVNPFNPQHRATINVEGNGLAAMNAEPGGPDTFILFAAEPTRVAFDGVDNASNSPFTQAFANAISKPGSTLEAVYRQVYDQVKETTEGRQRPYQEGVLFRFTFREAEVSPELASGQISFTSGEAGVSPEFVSGQTRLLETGLERRQYDVIRDGADLLKQVLETKSINEIQKAAEAGDSESQYLLAIAYHVGQGVATDPKLTAYWLRRSATRGFSRAQFAYGQRLYWGWGEIEPNKAEGFDWWLVAAENANGSAMLEIGDTYRLGREGVPNQDFTQAEKYYNQALSIGHLEAETHLGHLYGMKATTAKKQGDTDAFEQASKKKLVYYQNAADKGSSVAMYELAYMYRYGDYVEVDLPKAIQWYKKSTTAGNSTAAEELANLYADESKTGLGEPQPEEAAKYFRIALELGSETAGVALADLIKKGKVTSKTPDEALNLYEQALANGSLRAASSLSEVYLKGELVEKDLKKAEQYALMALELLAMTEPDSEDAWPLYIRLAAYNLLKLYQEEGLQPAKPELVNKLVAQVGPLDGPMKRFTVPVACGAVTSSFHVYTWDWELDEPPTDAQFNWVKEARGCEVPTDVIESFQKLYKIARENNVSFSELTVYALGQASKKKGASEEEEAGNEQ
ncbi:MAG: DUF2610 domain-containing protein [Symploca sp. SIO2E6]|nr:DUF2610 domain-containing protein [Symploca sp. SIO2E6]